MRAAVFRGEGQSLSIEDVPDPVPKPYEVVIRVERCGICGTDLHMTDGKGFLQAPPGRILGHEFAGEIVAVGLGITRHGIGDRITALAAIAACGRCTQCQAGDRQWCTGTDRLYPDSGGYAQYAPVPEPQIVPVPQSVAAADAALVEPLAVGLHGVRLADLQPGMDVVVLGAGPIGLAAVFWARRLGARKILVTATSRRRERYARAQGADGFVLGGPQAAAEIIDALGGPPAVVIEAAGAPGAIETAMQIVETRGTVVVLGWCGVPDAYVPALYLMKEIRLQFSMTYAVADFQDAIDALDAGAAEPRAMVTDTIALTDLPAAFEELRSTSAHCKVLVDPWT